MTIGHSYSNPTGRHIFRLRDFGARPEHGFDLEQPTPDGYTQLAESEKLDTAEFVDFLITRRSETDPEKREHFYMRDDFARPATSTLTAPADAPAHYAELDEEERFHVHEFIAFLTIRRTA